MFLLIKDLIITIYSYFTGMSREFNFTKGSRVRFGQLNISSKARDVKLAKTDRGPEVKLNFLTSVKSNCIQFYRFFLPSLNSDSLQKSTKNCVKNPPKYVISHSATRGLCQGLHELNVANYFLELYLICYCTCMCSVV